MCFTAISDAHVGIERIGAQLRAEEVPEGVNVQEDARWALNVKGDFEFEKTTVALQITGKAGALVCIVGRVGSGKSALLSGMITELRPSTSLDSFRFPMPGGDLTNVGEKGLLLQVASVNVSPSLLQLMPNPL
ncbi:uncharacterized protein IAS62_001605 [Cryptococcus decagattii]|uniref:ABC transporter domain-containing protein n=1 Tax=Cryptococcus decagattii TaxID=1859122 RepID=A0ABZ2ASY5_9TREE